MNNEEKESRQTEFPLNLRIINDFNFHHLESQPNFLFGIKSSRKHSNFEYSPEYFHIQSQEYQKTHPEFVQKGGGRRRVQVKRIKGGCK